MGFDEHSCAEVSPDAENLGSAGKWRKLFPIGHFESGEKIISSNPGGFSVCNPMFAGSILILRPYGLDNSIFELHETCLAETLADYATVTFSWLEFIVIGADLFIMSLGSFHFC